MALSLGLSVLMGRLLSPREFGNFALVTTMFGLAHELTDLGTGNLAVRGAASARTTERQSLEHLLGVRLMLSLAAAAICAGFALTQSDGMLRAMLLATAAVLAFSYVSAFSTVFQLRQAPVAPAVLSVTVQLGVLLAAGALLLMVPAGGGWAPGLVVAREVVVVVGTQVLAVRLLGYTPWPRLNGAELRLFVRAAAIVALGSLAFNFQLQGGLFWVGFMRPGDEVGAFAAALRPLAPLLFLPWIVMQPLVPLLSYLAAHNRSAFRRQARGTIDLTLGLGGVIAVATFQLADPVLDFLYGARFSTGPLSAVATLQWLALPLGGSFVVAAMFTVQLADHREGALLRLIAAALIPYTGANLVLLPRYGFLGSAVATAFSIGLIVLGGLFVLRSAAEIRPGRRTAMVVLPGTVLCLLLQLMPGPAPMRLALGSLLTGAALIAVWRFPSLSANRAEQAALTQQALAAHA
jgi:O-antigen/teichoic acid export membrane protein